MSFKKTKDEVIEFIEMLNGDGLNYDIIVMSPQSGDEIYIITGTFDYIQPGIGEIQVNGINITKFVHATVLEANIMNEVQKKTLANRINSETNRTRYYSALTPYVRYVAQYHS